MGILQESDRHVRLICSLPEPSDRALTMTYARRHAVMLSLSQVSPAMCIVVDMPQT
jgi:hypothetical protein